MVILDIFVAMFFTLFFSFIFAMHCEEMYRHYSTFYILSAEDGNPLIRWTVALFFTSLGVIAFLYLGIRFIALHLS